MISVKDREIMNKREAFLQTIQTHKEMANTHQNAVFTSAQKRFAPSKKQREEALIEA